MSAASAPSPADAADRTRRARRVARLGLAVGATGLAVGTAAWFGLEAGGRPVSTSNARWIAPAARVFDDTVTAVGTIRLKSGASVRVGAQQSGIVRALRVTVGTHVRRGDLIARIDDRPARARAAQLQAQLARALVQAEKAASDARRAQTSFAAGGISRQQLEDAEAAAAVAKASADIARRDLDVARLDLTYLTLRAPIDGVVASISTQQGETVASAFAAPTFVTIIDPQALELVVSVDEADIGAVRVGEPVTFTTETFPDREFAGRVVRIAPDATLVSGVVNYEVAVAIAAPAASLRPQMTANAVIRTGQRRALVVPAAAVRNDAAGRFVLARAPDGRAVRRAVAVGGRVGGDLEIRSGLSPRDHVLSPLETAR